MARRRRPGSRTSVVDGRAVLIVPAEAFETAGGEQMHFGGAKDWLAKVSSYPGVLGEGRPTVALVVDGFAYDLHLGDLAFTTDTHEGTPYRDAAVTSGVDVYITDDLDPRRSKPEDFNEAAKRGKLLGAHVLAYAVDKLSD